MTLNELYKLYGQQMIELEILNSKIQQTKQALANEINKLNQQVQSKPVDVSSESTN